MTPKIFQPARQSFREMFRSTGGMVFALVLCGLIAHGVVLGGSFKAIDDESLLVNNQNPRGLSSLARILIDSFSRGDRTFYPPLVTFSFLLDYQIAGLKPFFYYLTNLLLHLANAILLFFTFDTFLKRRSLGFAAALLFVVHPVQWEAVANIAGRSILLCAFWQFAAFLLYLTYAARSRLDPRREVYYVCALAAFSLALLSGGSAAVLPLLIGGYGYWMGRRHKGKVPTGWSVKRVLPFAAVVAGYFLLSAILGIANVVFWPSWQYLVFGVLTFLSSVLVSLRMFILPVDLHFDRTTAYFTSWAEPGVWLTLAAIVIFGSMAGRYHRQWSRRAKFLLFWFAATLLPVAQLVPLPAHAGYAATAEHSFYIPSAGLFAFFVLFARAVFQRAIRRKAVSGPPGRLLVAAVFIYFMLFTISQDLRAINELNMFERSLAYDPRNTRVRIFYALALSKAGFFARSEEEFRKVLAVEPWDTRARIGFAKSLCGQGKCLEAVLEYEAISDAGGTQGLLEDNLKDTYDTVIRQYQKRLEQEPQNVDLHYSLGVMFAKAGRSREAVREYLQVLRLDPRSRPALYNLGSFLESGPQPELAVTYFKRVIAFRREEDQLTEYAYRHLSKICERRGQTRRARAYSQMAEKIAGRGVSLEAGMK